MMKKIMKRAWEIAREGVKRFGGKVKEYFAEALKLAWKEVKNIMADAKKSALEPGQKYIPLGEIKGYIQDEIDLSEVFLDGATKIKEETEKAVLIAFEGRHGMRFLDDEPIDWEEGVPVSVWLPKSQIEITDEYVTVPEWKVEKIRKLPWADNILALIKEA